MGPLSRRNFCQVGHLETADRDERLGPVRTCKQGGAIATFSTSSLSVGTQLLTAGYPGDFNFSPSTSNTVTEAITGPASRTRLTVSPARGFALQPITLTAVVGSAYATPSGTVTFTAGGATWRRLSLRPTASPRPPSAPSPQAATPSVAVGTSLAARPYRDLFLSSQTKDYRIRRGRLFFFFSAGEADAGNGGDRPAKE